MRGLRWVLLLAIAIILAGVGGSYYIQRAKQARDSPPPPQELPPNVAATSDLWIHTEYDGDRPVVEIRAEKMRQIREPSEFELNGVELRIFQPGGYDRIRSAQAHFDIEKHSLYSEGDVEITLDVPAGEGLPELDLVVIESSGVHFDTELGKATTDRPTRFRFARGKGEAVGASYDPGWGDVRMHSQVRLEWFGDDASSARMIVEAGELVYKEEHSKVYLSPWSKFSRAGLTLNAADSVVELEDESISRVLAQQAYGSNVGEIRRIHYAADQLDLDFNPTMTMRHIVGRGNAKLESSSAGARTQVTSNELFLEFRPGGGDNELDYALAMGEGKLESRSAGGSPPRPARILSSETIKTIMRPGGQEIDVIETHAPGVVEFIPSAPNQTYRRLDAGRIKMVYGDHNVLKEFQATQVSTKSQAPDSGDEQPPPSLTWSDGLVAHFDDKGEVRELQQWGDFRYEEGEQQARSDHAVFRLKDNVIYLKGNARMWNTGGSTSANEISLDQAQNRITASGRVSSTRLAGAGDEDEDRKPSGILSPSETIHATARNMVANSDGSYISYTGNVVMWQGANRLLAGRVDISREKGTLKAFENVKTQFPERRSNTSEAAPPGSAPMTVVSSGEMVYQEEIRRAHYKGGVTLLQDGLRMDSDELRAFFSDPDASDEENAGSSLDKALADGGVRIVRTANGRKREGIAEHAEYHLSDERLVLTGGRPKMIDSERGVTQGARLTYFARDDRLQVDGADSRPAVTSFRRR